MNKPLNNRIVFRTLQEGISGKDYCLKFSITLRKLKSGILLLLLGWILLFTNPLKAEGTREIMQNQNHPGRILLDPDFGDFAMKGSGPNDRLHIRINEVGETIYFGIGNSVLSDGEDQVVSNDVLYQIIDPQGNIIVSLGLQPLSGPGYINSYTEAVAGPDTFSGSGYEPLVLNCGLTGDYYIEFDFPDAEYGGRREFEFFDITVADVNNDPVKGRVWSKAWMFTVTEEGGDPWANPFYGKVFILTDDGIVSSVDFNGMKPFVFTLSANGTGVQNTGNSIFDRKSVDYKSTYPQYKVFLNDPDPVCFPSGEFGDFSSPTTISKDGDEYCINVNTTKSGAIQVLIDFNGVPGYQVGTRDVLLAQNVGDGLTCIQWDGIDGEGNYVSICSEPVKFYVTYIGGLTHMPIYDVENNESGFIIELVRPATSGSHLALYWDDSNIPGFYFPPSGGCDGTQGCHKFDNFFGDERTINTWWYSTSKIVDSVEFLNSEVFIDKVLVENQTCSNKQNGSIGVQGSGGTPPFSFAIEGFAYQNLNYFQNLTAGSYTVKIKDANNCVKERNVSVGLNTLIEANFESELAGAYNQMAFNFIGQGANFYLWDFGDGQSSNLQNPQHEYAQDSTYSIKLIIESGSPDFCVDSTFGIAEIYAPLQIFAPTAFSPNGDNLNDTFELFGSGFQFYEIYIFSRNGTQVFYSNNIDISWDGLWKSNLCETGVYAYIVNLKSKRGEGLQKVGTVTLLH